LKAYEKDQKQSTGEERVKRKADHDDQVHEPCTLHPRNRLRSRTGYEP
jgi:hypothetical protein